MDKETQKEMKKNQELIDHYDYLKNAASSTDCTGLIPALPGGNIIPYETSWNYHI